MDGGDGGSDPALGAADGDDGAAGAGDLLGSGAEVAADADGPLGGGLDAAGELLVTEGQGDESSRAGVHGGGEEDGAGVGGDEDDADGGEAEGDLADEFERRDGSDPLVDQDDLGEFVE